MMVIWAINEDIDSLRILTSSAALANTKSASFANSDWG